MLHAAADAARLSRCTAVAAGTYGQVAPDSGCDGFRKRLFESIRSAFWIAFRATEFSGNPVKGRQQHEALQRHGFFERLRNCS
jgi:hypothetical protein